MSVTNTLAYYNMATVAGREKIYGTGPRGALTEKILLETSSPLSL